MKRTETQFERSVFFKIEKCEQSFQYISTIYRDKAKSWGAH